ncbi:MAG: hypothetical protein K2L95_00535 [Alphaproteobacteria bacterium]|nr:hypothetical protein [Alphaproteobacteria bacterium]MDE6570693.1 hypothetical protein [Alphaproteobacteria bacterium]
MRITHKILSIGFAAIVAMTGGAARAADNDTNDPLYRLALGEVLSQTSLSFWDSTLRLGQDVSYGFSNRFSAGINAHYQFDFDGDEDGFSNIDIGGNYRLAWPSDSNSRIVSDLLVGLKFGGSSHVRTPEYADTIYYAGIRMGRQWTGMTLAATLKTSWIFDDDRGMAYIDLSPEAYFRINPNWRLGAGFMLRKATKPHYDQEWIDFKVIRQYGRTQYLAHVDYEFESDEVQVGTRVNILF